MTTITHVQPQNARNTIFNLFSIYNLLDVSRATVFNMINIVVAAIIHRLGFLINWPSDADCRRQIAQKFYQLHNPGIPNVCGALDGTLVPIIAPHIDEVQYIDRHQGHSINAMAVSGSGIKY